MSTVKKSPRRTSLNSSTTPNKPAASPSSNEPSSPDAGRRVGGNSKEFVHKKQYGFGWLGISSLFNRKSTLTSPFIEWVIKHKDKFKADASDHDAVACYVWNVYEDVAKDIESGSNFMVVCPFKAGDGDEYHLLVNAQGNAFRIVNAGITKTVADVYFAPQEVNPDDRSNLEHLISTSLGCIFGGISYVKNRFIDEAGERFQTMEPRKDATMLDYLFWGLNAIILKWSENTVEITREYISEKLASTAGIAPNFLSLTISGFFAMCKPNLKTVISPKNNLERIASAEKSIEEFKKHYKDSLPLGMFSEIVTVRETLKQFCGIPGVAQAWRNLLSPPHDFPMKKSTFSEKIFKELAVSVEEIAIGDKNYKLILGMNETPLRIEEVGNANKYVAMINFCPQQTDAAIDEIMQLGGFFEKFVITVISIAFGQEGFMPKPILDAVISSVDIRSGICLLDLTEGILSVVVLMLRGNPRWLRVKEDAVAVLDKIFPPKCRVDIAQMSFFCFYSNFIVLDK